MWERQGCVGGLFNSLSQPAERSDDLNFLNSCTWRFWIFNELSGGVASKRNLENIHQPCFLSFDLMANNPSHRLYYVVFISA